jgi:hypothetical protein
MDELSPVCYRCVVERLVARRIKEEGVKRPCAFCENVRRTITIEELGDIVQPVYEKYAVPAEDDFEIDGDNARPVEGGEEPPDIVEELLECDRAVADAVATYLEKANAREVVRGATDYYAADSRAYTLRVPPSSKHEKGWAGFEQAVKHEARFFNTEQERYLNELLGPCLKGDVTGGLPPIIEAGVPRTGFRFIYRAREANTRAARKDIYENPRQRLAPPPPLLRKQGRMNPVGVTAFYGCSDITTCIAELRLPVGGTAVVGRFKITRPIRLLDLRRLDQSRAASNISWFDEALVEKYAYVAFMRGFHALIRKPVLPDDEALEYLPTQLLAEYLSTRLDPPIDGVVFASAQTGERTKTTGRNPKTLGLNVTLFAPAALVEGTDDRPTVQVLDVREPDGEDEEEDRDDPYPVDRREHVEIRKIQAQPIAAEAPDPTAAWFADDEEQPAIVVRAPQPTLRLVLSSIRKVRVKSIRHRVKATHVVFDDEEDKREVEY